jgi:hypothetical protein
MHAQGSRGTGVEGQVKNILKEESVFDYGVRERELIAFRIPRGKSIASVIPDAATGIGKGDTAQALRKGAGAGEAHAMAMLGFM